MPTTITYVQGVPTVNPGREIIVPAVIFGILLLAALIMSIIALVYAVHKPSSAHNRAFMARTNVADQTLTGGVPTIITFDTLEGASYGFTYENGKFTAEHDGFYSFVGNLSINVSGPSGGGGATIGPLTAWVVKDGNPIMYGIGNYIPLDLSFVSGNSQYAQWSTMLQMEEGESVSVHALSATHQVVLGGATSYAAIGAPDVTSC